MTTTEIKDMMNELVEECETVQDLLPRRELELMTELIDKIYYANRVIEHSI